MDELTAVLEASRDHTHEERKFFAALKGVDLDKETGGRSPKGSGSGNPWEDMKARVFSGGAAKDARDIVSLQGATGKKAGMTVGGAGADIQYSKTSGDGW